MELGCLCADFECVRASKFIRALSCICEVKVQIDWLWPDFETWRKELGAVVLSDSGGAQEAFCRDIVDFGVWWLSTQSTLVKQFGSQPVFLADKPVGIVDVE